MRLNAVGVGRNVCLPLNLGFLCFRDDHKVFTVARTRK